MRLGRLNSLQYQINRQAGNIATIVTAHLRQPVGRSIGRARCRDARRQIASKIIVGVGRKHAGVDVVVAVAPERGPKTAAPDRIVIDVKISERPEQRSDPSISAIGVLPPSASSPTVIPARHRRASGDPGANIGVTQRDRVAQCAGKRTRVHRVVHAAGSHVVDGVAPTTAEVRTAAEMSNTMAATTEMCATMTTAVMTTTVMTTTVMTAAVTTTSMTATFRGCIPGGRQHGRENNEANLDIEF